MRVAFIGKGGAGKSTIVGTFSRLLAQQGERVLVLDSDVMPGLAHALGVEPTDSAIPDDAVDEYEDEPRFRLRLSAEDAVEAHARACPDGVRLLQLGKLRGPASDITRSQFAYRQITRELPEESWHLVGDLPGGTRQPFFGWGAFATTMLVVVEPTAKSYLTARRLLRLAEMPHSPSIVAVANKVSEPGDRRRVEEATGLEVVAEIPWDPAVGRADRDGRALLEVAPDGPAVQAIAGLADRLRDRRYA